MFGYLRVGWLGLCSLLAVRKHLGHALSSTPFLACQPLFLPLPPSRHQVLMIQGFLAVRKHSDRISLLVEMMVQSGCPCFKSKVAAVQGLKKRLALNLPEHQVWCWVCGIVVRECEVFGMYVGGGGRGAGAEEAAGAQPAAAPGGVGWYWVGGWAADLPGHQLGWRGSK